MSRDALAESRRARHRSLWLKRFALGAAFCLVIIVGFLALNSDELAIKDVAIVGAEILSPEELLIEVEKNLNSKWFGIISKKNAWLYPRQSLAQALVGSLPRLSQVAFVKPRLDSLLVEVKERQATMMFCGTAGCFLADQTGFIFSTAPDFSFPAVLGFELPHSSFGIADRPISRAELERLQTFASAVHESLAGSIFEEDQVISVALLPHNDYRLAIGSGRFKDNPWGLMINQQQDYPSLARNLKLVLATLDFKAEAAQHNFDLDYIDLRFDDKVFYKFKNEIEEPNA